MRDRFFLDVLILKTSKPVVNEPSSPHFAALASRIGLLSSIHTHLESCTYLAAHLAQAPVAWLSLWDLQYEPILIGTGCSVEKLQQLNQAVSHHTHASDSTVDNALLISGPDQNPTFKALPSGTNSDIRYGIAWPLSNAAGIEMGRLYIGDHISRRLAAEQLNALERLVQQIAWMVEAQITRGAIAPGEASQSELLWKTNQQLRFRIESLQEEHFYLTLLNNFMDTLQDYTTLEEAIAHLPALLQATFPNHSGRLYISTCGTKSNAKTDLCTEHTEVLAWGTGVVPRRQRLPGDCPVVQTTRPHFSVPDTGDGHSACSSCQIPEALSPQDNFCVPLLTSNAPRDPVITGVLSINTLHPTVVTQRQRQLTTQVAHHLGKVLTRLKRYEMIHVQSIRDALTGLFNRRYLFEVLPKIFQRAYHGHYSVGVIVFDIDHFKRFNDCYGHLAGDKVLQDFGVFLKGFVRGTDIACRYGGEEFMLVLPEATLERVIQRANRLRQGMHYMKMEYRGKPLGKVTISAGVASFPYHGATAEQVIAAADAALYQAKADGRDRINVAQKPNPQE